MEVRNNRFPNGRERFSLARLDYGEPNMIAAPVVVMGSNFLAGRKCEFSFFNKKSICISEFYLDLRYEKGTILSDTKTPSVMRI